MYRLHSHCRACGYAKPTVPPGIKSSPSREKLFPVFSLGNQPLANAFAGPDDIQSAFYPLEVLLCPKCFLAQLSVVVKPEVLYANYPYTTSRSETMKQHFESLWQEVGLECGGAPESVVEIGSNDGYFLEFALANGANAVCGIDPARNLSRTANGKGIQTFCGVFDKDTAGMARSCVPPVNLIMARHVFCHIDDWHNFIGCLELLGGKSTLIVIEVPYVMDLLKNVEFDTIYHEHLSYMNLKAMVALLAKTRFRIQKVVQFEIHGGSIAIMIRRDDYEKPANDIVLEMLECENITEQSWKRFGGEVANRISALGSAVQEFVDSGKRVVGYGASAKSSVWLNALGFTRKEVAFVCDSTPEKWYKNSPGTDIPVVDEGALLREMPDYAVLWSWNYESEILAKNQLWRDRGGRFIVPSRDIKIV